MQIILSYSLLMSFSLLQEEFENIAHFFKDHDHVRLILTYDEPLSHLIYAASDMMAIPSILEPCGLTPVKFKTLSIHIYKLRQHS